MASSQSQLFKSFGKDKVSGHSQLKASVQRAIRGEGRRGERGMVRRCGLLFLLLLPGSGLAGMEAARYWRFT